MYIVHDGKLLLEYRLSNVYVAIAIVYIVDFDSESQSNRDYRNNHTKSVHRHCYIKVIN